VKNGGRLRKIQDVGTLAFQKLHIGFGIYPTSNRVQRLSAIIAQLSNDIYNNRPIAS